MELDALQKSLGEFKNLGANLVAVSPQTPENNAAARRENKLEFPVLSDLGNQWAKKLSLPFSLPPDLQEVYRGFGIDLAQSNGDESWELPLPARIVIDRDGIIRRIDADPDYTRRPEPEATLAVLQNLN